MFTPADEQARKQLDGAAHLLKEVTDDIRRELDHVDSIMEGSASEIKHRHATMYLVSLLGSLTSAVKGSRWELSKAARELEECVQTVHDAVMGLEYRW